MVNVYVYGDEGIAGDVLTVWLHVIQHIVWRRSFCPSVCLPIHLS